MDEHGLLRDIERMMKREIDRVPVEGFEPDPSIRAQPIQQGRRGQGNGRKPAANGHAARGTRRHEAAAGKPRRRRPGGGRPQGGNRPDIILLATPAQFARATVAAQGQVTHRPGQRARQPLAATAVAASVRLVRL